MDNAHPEVITVTLGEKEYRLKFGIAALRLARVKHGVSISLAELTEPSLDMMGALFWISLLPGHPDITEEAALMLLAEAEDETAILRSVLECVSRFGEAMKALNPTSRRKGKK